MCGDIAFNRLEFSCVVNFRERSKATCLPGTLTLSSGAGARPTTASRPIRHSNEPGWSDGLLYYFLLCKLHYADACATNGHHSATSWRCFPGSNLVS